MYAQIWKNLLKSVCHCITNEAHVNTTLVHTCNVTKIYYCEHAIFTTIVHCISFLSLTLSCSILVFTPCHARSQISCLVIQLHNSYADHPQLLDRGNDTAECWLPMYMFMYLLGLHRLALACTPLSHSTVCVVYIES